MRTPALDELVQEGVSFERSYCAAAACQPSRASLFTGIYPNLHGVTQTGGGCWLPPALPTFPRLLGAAGYRTAAVGKMHAARWDDPCGFHERVIIESKYSAAPDEYRRYLAANDLTRRVIGHHQPGFGQHHKAMASDLRPDEHIDGYIARRGGETLQRLIDAEAPFLLWVSFCGPHDPYDPAPPYSRLYEPSQMLRPRRAPGELDQLPPAVRAGATAFGIAKMNLHGISDAEHQRMRALYYGNVSQIDAGIGQLLKTLDERGLAAQTLVVFTSDHGDYLGDHDLMWKALLPSEADMRVPLILRWPDRLPPGRRQELVSGVDLMPTLLAAGGVDIPAHLQGKTLFDVLEGRSQPRQHLLMFSEPNKWRYRDDRWAYTWWPDQPFDTLYDLQADPYELHNLAAPPASPAPPHPMVRRLRSLIAHETAGTAKELSS